MGRFSAQSYLKDAIYGYSPTPEQIQQKAQAGLKPYFPQVTVAVDKRQQMLVGYTCTDLGKPLLEMMPKVLDEKPEVQQLKTYRSFAQLQSFALGFEQQVLYLDLASGRYFIVTAESLPGYVAGYQQNCNAVRSTTTPNTAGNPSPDNRVNLGEPIGGPVPVGGRGLTPPSVLTRVEPQYTEAARRARCQGTSVLNVVQEGWDCRCLGYRSQFPMCRLGRKRDSDPQAMAIHAGDAGRHSG